MVGKSPFPSVWKKGGCLDFSGCRLNKWLGKKKSWKSPLESLTAPKERKVHGFRFNISPSSSWKALPTKFKAGSCVKMFTSTGKEHWSNLLIYIYQIYIYMCILHTVADWWFQPSSKILVSQIRSSPQAGVKIKPQFKPPPHVNKYNTYSEWMNPCKGHQTWSVNRS